MKRILFGSLAILVTFALVTPTSADLVTRGQGKSVHGTYNLIYDDDRNITWYDYSNVSNTWNNQLTWADTLSVDFGVNTYEDWRLPTALNQNGTGPGVDSVSGSEMGHLYYIEFGNVHNGGLKNTDDFLNLTGLNWYWSGTDIGIGGNAWIYIMSHGVQVSVGKGEGGRALAVLDGDVTAVPEPSLGLLLGISLIGLVGVGVVRKIKQMKVANS